MLTENVLMTQSSYSPIKLTGDLSSDEDAVDIDQLARLGLPW